MSISTKRGDSGYTDLLGGERVPKYHMRTEAVGILDETNSFLGLARASSKNWRIKRILLEAQEHLFIIGAEVSREGDKPLKKTISETEVSWLDSLVEEYEAVLSIPPKFAPFGQEETSSHMDVARASVRKAERIVVKLNAEGKLESTYVLKYLNRLSDLLYLLARFEEREEKERREINQTYFPFHLAKFFSQEWAIFTGSIILSLVAAIIFCSAIHCHT